MRGAAIAIFVLLSLSRSPITSTGASHAAMWLIEPSMLFARNAHTATLLLSGEVLVTGGLGTDHRGPLVSAEIFNPIAHAWKATGSLHVSRWAHTATLLLDGAVLVTGGIGSDEQPLRSAEIYDPKTGSWGPTGSMIYARAFHSATQLLDGRVLVVGGTGAYPASAEIYDPHTGKWTLTSSMAVGRLHHQAVLLPSGSVLVMGGDTPGAMFPPPSTEEFVPATASWKSVPPMHAPRDQFTATLLANGKVLVVGSPANVAAAPIVCASTSRAAARRCAAVDAEIFDPIHDRWTVTAPPLTRRVDHSATRLLDGDVLIAGGGCGELTEGTCPYTLKTAELYCPSMGRWIQSASLNTARRDFQATLLSNGTVLVTGGITGNGATSSTVALASSELYVPSTSTNACT